MGFVPAVFKEMATHSSILAWKIPGMEEPGRLQSMELQRVGHDWATSLSLSLLVLGGSHSSLSEASSRHHRGAWCPAKGETDAGGPERGHTSGPIVGNLH